MTIEEMRQKKKAKGYTDKQIAELSGVPIDTVQKIFTDEMTHPPYDTIQALERIFDRDMYIREEAEYSGHRQGSYTVEDYYALPEEQRAELIDGYFYDMSSPNMMHQEIVEDIVFQIRNYIEDRHGKCKVYFAPLDVRLNKDNRTIVQPDIIILCDESKRRKWGIMGAPDFVLEVVSPSTKNKDYALKAGKYMEAGVREYWVVDPYKKIVVVFDFEHEEKTTVLGMEQLIPVGIYHGDLKIAFDGILQTIDEFDNLAE